MFDKLRTMLGIGNGGVSASSVIPGPPAPKVGNKQLSLPSYLRTAKPNPKSALPLTDRQLANTDITTLRTGLGSRQVIRDFARASPDLSAAITAYVRTGITSGFTAVAKNLDGSFNPEATSTLTQILTRMNTLNDYTLGYDDSLSIRSLSETWARDLMMTGAMAGELVLNKARLPDKIQPVGVAQVSFLPSPDGRKLRPIQTLGGEEIDLDIPTFFMVALDQDPQDAYAVSPIEPAIQAVLFSADFMNDIRRIVKKAIHPRVVVTINEEKFREFLPKEVMNDQKEFNAYMAGVISELESRVNNLAPEDAMIAFDTIGFEVMDHGNTNLSNEYSVVQSLIDAKMATGAKVLPTVLGHSSGTSNVASAEVLVFMKYVEGTIWAKLNEMFSKVLTLAVRLLGHDVFVEFTYNSIDLRPDSELESFRAMKQSRILELLSLGLIGDEEAAVALTGHLPREGYTPLAGTRFHQKSVAPAGDGYNGASNNGSTMNQNIRSDAPKGVKSKGEAGAVVVPLQQHAQQ